MKRRAFLISGFGALLANSAFGQQSVARYLGELILKPLDGDRLMEVQQPFGYSDEAGKMWAVPTKALVDGASIPRVFWSILGGPWDGRYRDASVVHDWFCAVRIMPWQATHRMFYEAMLTSGTDSTLAKTMFLAVRYCGPSWDSLTLQNSRILTHDGTQRLDPPNARLSTNGFASDSEARDARTQLVEKFENLAGEVKRRNLSASEIEQLIDQHGRQESTAAMLPY
ncbi:DUF1353 domain-containing protein [Tunturiibacter gelidiferens]|uniref:DUF1353 domain-containing protein n=1 Tax=Tunturiibacter gelidiferens TaxID=3069689 RepID=UPI003D9BD1EE